MKKVLTFGVLLITAIFLAAAQPGYAYLNVTAGGCLSCHTFAGGSGANHTTHTGGSVSCASCHAGGIPGKNVTSSACVVCHPTGNAGACNLVNLPEHTSASPSCLTCHASCTVTTTTTIPSGESCTDNDGDTYGDNCTAGPDCDDADPAIHDGCQSECALQIRPHTFSLQKALVAPIQFFTIRADRNSSLSFAGPICISWESDAIDDIFKLRIGEKLIIGFVRIDPSNLTAGNFNVQVCYGDLSETACGPIEVTGSSASSYFFQEKRVNVMKKCDN